ncbi:MAG: SLC13/DASS family transporter, partial [Planctomycetaceae bacterium]|nr:SLC13/DASS family transporter [Planctomycetaceae bacterium]
RNLLIPGLVLVVTAWLFLLPLPEGMRPQAHRLAAVALLMAGLWITQAIPLAATSLIPLFLFPLLGIETAAITASAYANDTLFLYLGGMVIALGIERWGLHRRVALNLVATVGVSPRRLVLGFMASSAGLSMWMSNTACTVMMLPIAMALLQTIDEDTETHGGDRLSDQLAVPLLLAIAYSASLGGMTTLVGTPTNAAAINIYRKETGDTISVAEWLLACGPIGLTYLAVTWFVLTRRLPVRSSHQQVLKEAIAQRVRQLGKMAPAERRMLTLFLLTAVLWVFRRRIDIGGAVSIPGWSEPLCALLERWFPWQLTGKESFTSFWEIGNAKHSVFSDSTVAMAIAVLMFMIPSGTRDHRGHSQPLMDWPTATRVPWDMILLFGGGFALANAFTTTGLSEWIGGVLQGPLHGKPAWLIVAALCLLMTFLTELTSNVATVTTLMPTLLLMAEPLGIDARLLFVPACLATSCAFMLPIATPPNAIVFGSGRISGRQMASYGFLLNIVG